MRLRMLAFAATTLAFFLGLSVAVYADPCLVVYPSGPCVYHYDPAEYYTVGLGHPLYDSEYDRGGQVLLDIVDNEVDMTIYQAPGLMGFVQSTSDQGFYFIGTTFDLIIDGWSNVPTTYVNILVVFDQFVPEPCSPTISVNGSPLSGTVYNAGDLVGQTPVGNNYSDALTLHVSWQGCYGVHAWAFSDEDYDGTRDGGECFTAFSHDMETPVQQSTWGLIKTLFR